jgi:AraC-like DNA-binding protein
MRLDAARRRLEESEESVVQVASDCGFGSLDSMRRAFEEYLGITPHTYRERYLLSLLMLTAPPPLPNPEVIQRLFEVAAAISIGSAHHQRTQPLG